MSATTIIAQAFGEGANLYTTVLGIQTTVATTNPSLQSSSSSSSSASFDTSTITPSQLRKAYYKRALLYHPDKQSNSNSKSDEDAEETKLKFQAVSLAYTILSDATKRREYDATGELDDADDDDDSPTSSSGTKAWTDYFRSVFGPVTPDDIDKFTLSYKCSESERSDVLKYYTKFGGDLNRILEYVMCSEEGVVDKRRWVEDYIKPAILEGIVEGGKLAEMMERTLEDDDDDDDEEEVEMDLDEEDLDDEDEEDEGKESDDDDNDDDDTETDLDSDEDEKRSTRSKTRQNSKRQPPKATTSTKRKRPRPLPKVPKASAKRKTTDSTSNASAVSDDLIAAIRGNRSKAGSGFGSMLAGMEERYGSSSTKGNGGGGGSKSKRKSKSKSKKPAAPQEEISDKEFDRIRARLDSQRKKRKAGSSR